MIPEDQKKYNYKMMKYGATSVVLVYLMLILKSIVNGSWSCIGEHNVNISVAIVTEI